MFTDLNLNHLRAIFAVYDKPFTKDIAKIYASTLKDWSEETIEHALDYVQATCKFCPKPVDINEAIKVLYKLDDSSLTVKAKEIFNQLAKNLQPYVSVVFAERRACFAFKQCFNSVKSFCKHSADERTFKADRDDFVDSYLKARNYKDEEPVALGSYNSGLNYVLLIGDKQKCLNIARQHFGRFIVVTDEPKESLTYNVKVSSNENKIEIAQAIAELSKFFGNV